MSLSLQTWVAISAIVIVAAGILTCCILFFRMSKETTSGSASERAEFATAALRLMHNNHVVHAAPVTMEGSQATVDITPNSLTISHNYYNNPSALRVLLANYWAAPSTPKQKLVLQIVDDGSGDTALQTVKSFIADYGTEDAPQQVRVVSLMEDIGFNVAGARNTGVEAAPTDVVYFCDVDMSPAPRKLASLIRGAEDINKNPMLMYTTQTTSWMVHKMGFRALGGVDEDFSGSYGHEEYSLNTGQSTHRL